MITRLVCDIAEFVALTINQQTLDTPISAIELLMPTIKSSIRPNNPEAITGEEVYPNLCDIPLQKVLKTHILGREGKFLLPIKLLTELEISPIIIPLRNPYVPESDKDAPAVFVGELYYVNEEEQVRLVKHSPFTQAISDASVVIKPSPEEQMFGINLDLYRLDEGS